MIRKNSTVLFQGDSVTDVGRSRENDSLLGEGYPALVGEKLAREFSILNIKVVNRGISGNRSRDLVARWQEDCINIQPDYLSILIGINDTWRKYDQNDPTPDEDFEDNMRTIIERTLRETKAEILLFVPFILDVNNGVSKMREDLVGKQVVIEKLAREYSLRIVNLDNVFRKLCADAAPSDFSADGVHPNGRGHEVICDEWFKAW